MLTIARMLGLDSSASWALGTSRGAILCLLVLASGCHLVFGDYEVDPNFGQGGAPGSGGAVATGGSGTDCTGDEWNCTTDGVLQHCQSGNWVTVQKCSEPKLCYKEFGRCVTCVPSDRQCNGTGSVEQCNDSQNGWITAETCEFPKVCDPVTATCECTRGQSTCQDAHTLVNCALNGSVVVSACVLADMQCHTVDGTNDYCSDCDFTGSQCTTVQLINVCSNGKTTAVHNCLEEGSKTGCQQINGVWSCK
jgi:hypothetical protein